jgi:uncharacterized protein
MIFFVLGVLVPWRGRVRLRELLAKPHVGTGERVSLYASTIAFQWVAAGVVGWRAWVRGFSAAQLGLIAYGGWKVAVVGLLGAGLFGTLHWLNLRRMSRLSTKTRGGLQALAERILPQSPIEILPFLALAVTAGVCEEFLYRGFTMAALHRAGLPAWSVLLLSSALFGMAHLYQGRGGLVGTMILGILFAAARIRYDSLVPVIFWHVAVDVVAGIAGPRYLTSRSAPIEDVAI